MSEPADVYPSDPDISLNGCDLHSSALLESYTGEHDDRHVLLVLCVLAVLFVTISYILLAPNIAPTGDLRKNRLPMIMSERGGGTEEKKVEEKEPEELHQEEELKELHREKELEELHQVLKTRLDNYHGPLSNLTDKQCHRFIGSVSCFDPSCRGHFSPSLKERLREVLVTRSAIPDRYLQAMRSATSAVTSHKYILVTGASSNHFNEMQAMLHSMFTALLPKLEGEDLGLVIYNLGLTEEERKLTEKNCRCTVVDFPFADLPDFVGNLTCYIWKPLIVQSLLEKAEYLAWVDASIRFRQSDPIRNLFQRAKDYGFQSRMNRGSIAVRTRPSAAAFFGDKLCQYSPFYEMEANFMIFYNDRFTREAIMKPWLSCAFDRTCMCPHNTSLTRCTSRHLYGVCHRFDQSAIGMIFSKLYLEHRRMLIIPPPVIKIRRHTKMDWFKTDP